MAAMPNGSSKLSGVMIPTTYSSRPFRCHATGQWPGPLDVRFTPESGHRNWPILDGIAVVAHREARLPVLRPTTAAGSGEVRSSPQCFSPAVLASLVRYFGSGASELPMCFPRRVFGKYCLLNRLNQRQFSHNFGHTNATLTASSTQLNEKYD